MSDLSVKQCKASVMLAGGEKKRVVAKKVGVTPQTICGWLKDPEFEARLNREKEGFLEETRNRMRKLGPTTTDTLMDVMKNSKNPMARLKAVEIVLHHVGYTDPQTMLFAFGIGGKTKEQVEKEKSAQKMKDTFGITGL